MKKSLFMAGLMALAMVALVGCNKEQGAPSTDGEKATVSIRLQGVATRAYEPGQGDLDKKVYTLAAMVYNGNMQEAYQEAAADALEVKDIPCTAGGRKLVVVANFGDLHLQGLTLAELEAKTLTLAAAQQDPANKLHMMTSEVTPVDIKAGKNVYGKAPATGENGLSATPLMITHVHAGMQFETVTVAFNAAYAAKYSVNLKEKTQVMGLIAKAQSNIFGAPLANADTKYLYGEDHKSTAANAYTPANYALEASLLKDYKPTETAAGFYILENNNEKHPTILCLKTPLLDNAGAALAGDALAAAQEAGYCDDKGFTYYPVLVNWDLANYTYTSDGARKVVVRNNKYQITMMITGPGTNTPEEPVDEPATLDVTVKVAPWVLVAQNVTW